MKKKTYAEATILMERYRLAVVNHRDAVYSIAYKINGGPSFGNISPDLIERYENARVELMEIERELADNRFNLIR
jgi:hypothetical protein